MKNYSLGGEVYFSSIKKMIKSNEQSIIVGGREAKLLELFCNEPNKILDKATLMDVVWGNVIVCETSLTKAISNLRKYLAHFKELACEIKTVPKEGYVFIFENQDEDCWSIEEHILGSPHNSMNQPKEKQCDDIDPVTNFNKESNISNNKSDRITHYFHFIYPVVVSMLSCLIFFILFFHFLS